VRAQILAASGILECYQDRQYGLRDDLFDLFQFRNLAGLESPATNGGFSASKVA
jgi:hypothetical protein